MPFTVLFSDDEDTKDMIIDNLFGKSHIVTSANYNIILLNYKRAKFHLENNIFYDFYSHRKQAKGYLKFKFLNDTPLQFINTDTQDINDEPIVNHNVIILFDTSITSKQERIVVSPCLVRDLKKIIFDKLKLSVSKQEILRDNEVLENNVYLSGETVVLRQKRRSNKK